MKISVFIISFLGLFACGDNKSDSGNKAPNNGPIKQLFIDLSQQNEVPVRFLLAVALLESKITPHRSSTKYQDTAHSLGISLGETAFGLSYKTLGIPDDDTSRTLKAQLEAYIRLIKGTMKEKGLTLNANPTNIEDKFEWIWLLAKIHRGGLNSRRNIQIVFALELMDLLNRGFIWQNLETSEIIELTKEEPAFIIDELPSHLQDNLKLFTASSDIYSAQYFELTYQKPNDGRNLPNHIRVIHCPFSLSACLELQNPLEESDGVRLNAHYIIPQTSDLLEKPLQVAQHEQVLLLTGSDGIPESVQDAIIVMLVGESGRYVNGDRIKADPTWFSKYQLTQMGSIIRNLCPLMKEINPSIDVEKCILPGINGGVFFNHQGHSDEYQWGDIPDYDESIFWPYIDRPDSLEGGVGVQFQSAAKIFKADQEINMKVKFTRETAKIIVQQAERCPNNKLIWTILQNKRVRDATAADFNFTLYYQGPNSNGEHYLRILTYDIDRQLIGWDMQNIVLTDYSKVEGPSASVRDCQNYGT